MKNNTFRFLLFLTMLCNRFTPAHSQLVCFSDSATIYQFPAHTLPPLFGQATFRSGQYKVVVGGKFSDPLSPGSEGFYNCDMLVIDERADQMYVLPLSYFPPYVADQFSGVDYGFEMENDTAYLLGGYGYNLSEGYEASFPTLTIFSVKTLIDSVLQHKNYLDLFEAIDDERLAITGGTLVHIGDYFLVYGGKEVTSVPDEYSDRRTISEWDFHGQLRRFRLKSTEGYREVDDYQVCNTSKVFNQCMPAAWKGAANKTYYLDRQDK